MKNYPSLEEIKKDYNNLMKIVSGVTTIEDVRKMIRLHRLRVEIIERGRNNDIVWIRLESSFGSLDHIYCNIKNGMINNVIFDVWSDELDDYFISNTTIEDLTEENYQEYINI